MFAMKNWIASNLYLIIYDHPLLKFKKLLGMYTHINQAWLEKYLELKAYYYQWESKFYVYNACLKIPP